MKYVMGDTLPVPRDVSAAVRLAKSALRDAGLRVPKIRLRWVASISRKDGGEEFDLSGLTWMQRGVVHVTLCPSQNVMEAVAHEMAHAVLEPILNSRAAAHNSLWAAVYRALYVALVDGR